MTTRSLTRSPELPADVVQSLERGTFSDPFSILGPQDVGGNRIVRAFLPGARGVEVADRAGGRRLGALEPVGSGGLYQGLVDSTAPYMLRISWPAAMQETEDPYSFGPVLSDFDLHLFNEGRHFDLASRFGAQPTTIDGVPGVRFAVWAPNAQRVAVVGDFNAWDGRRHAMRLRHQAGVWEIFIPRLGSGERYKYEIRDRGGGVLPLKADPLALATEMPPGTASIVQGLPSHAWRDDEWMSDRARTHGAGAPISIYEVHAQSWRRRADGHALDWDELSTTLIPYVLEMGFTHLEFLPLAEHPFGGSWGYQPLGLFAPSRRHGEPAAFARFVERCHENRLGVIVDWVPAHFPSDSHGLARFDGTALYEHADPREGFHRDWNTLIYNFGRREVQGTLIASALHWLDHFHVDGLRVDAVASMLYRDYSRQPGEWVSNVYGGRENLEAVGFLRHLNAVVAERFPGVVTIAEESTAWPGVTTPADRNGLGFSYKWNMGWMHDTLRYMSRDPIHRRYHHDDLTFGLLYAFSEKFVLPLSHDEVVHGKGSLLRKMPGDRWQSFANLRAYLGFMWAHPGKKLLFMGGEIAQDDEWFHDGELAWHLLENPLHGGIRALVADLNRLYVTERALHARDSDPEGFQWVIGDDRSNSVFAFLRWGEKDAPPILAVSNMTPTPRHHYRIGVPRPGQWREILNTDSRLYAGSNMGNSGATNAIRETGHGFDHVLDLTLPPLATLYLRWEAAV